MPDETKSAAQLAAETKAAFERSVDSVKEIAEKALAESKKGNELAASFKEKADEALTGMNALNERMSEMEQKSAKAGRGGDEAPQSLGEQYVSSEEYKSFVGSNSRKGMAPLQLKADITTAASGAGAVGAAIAPNRLSGIQELPRRRLVIRSLLSPGRTDSPLIEYVREKGFTNNAAVVAEGAKKPQSDIELEDIQTSTKTIAHYVKVSKQALSDVSQLRSHIDGRLLFGLQSKEDQQLLAGDGVGGNMLGLIPQSTAFAAPIEIEGATRLDALRLAMLQAALSEYPASGHILNPIDLTAIEMLKDTLGRYIIGNPQGGMSPTLWGLPVAETTSMAAGKFMTGSFDLAAQIFDQWQSVIEVGFENDDFTRNKLTIRAEERLALAVYRPEALIYGDLLPVAGGEG
ncbi:phage major capsid protein [Pararhodobacter sp.]|uniref:phage major capsid protein n=1 Tax=Pararhodobacter sp. TaxID=2127056 RepID=UPI002AFE3393|nr:phage major capsid protein [Pararhodobacter sp.]